MQGVAVAHLSYTWGSNTEPPADPWMLNDTERPGVVIAAVDGSSAGAEIVILSLHAPYEMGRWPSMHGARFVGDRPASGPASTSSSATVRT